MSASTAAITPRGLRSPGGARRFAATENASAVVLLVATIVALVWANSPWSGSYDGWWETRLVVRLGEYAVDQDLRHWVNDGLMALFFFVAGLEIRRELDMGDLRERRRVAAPVLAAVGGMAVPAAIYLAWNAGDDAARGWGIVMGTDTAFAVGVLMLVGGGSPRVRTFLLSLVVVDDAVALTVIAVAYTEDLSVGPLLVAAALVAGVVGLRTAGVRNGVPYFVVGTGVWLATLASGIHATIAGVVMGLLASAYPPSRADLARAGLSWRLFREEPSPELAQSASRRLLQAVSPNERLQHLYHPWTSFVIVPVFALANAGVEVTAEALRDAARSPITVGIVAGLVIGKPLGIVGTTWLAHRLGHIPLTASWRQVFGAATVGGIGFTVSLLIAEISFDGEQLTAAKIGILAASSLAAMVSWGVWSVLDRLPGPTPAEGVAPPLEDLSDPVDPTVDHLRGSPDAALVLVEYGDFECPHCLGAEQVLDQLSLTFGDDLAVVFRHLPLEEVHEYARLAAEAAEAAALQGRFWEMHDTLFAHQDELDEPHLREYAGALGLDVDRFTADLHDRRHALRVERDIQSADDSGAAGTPTFFINGHRHHARPDIETLTAALRRELQIARSRTRSGGRRMAG